MERDLGIAHQRIASLLGGTPCGSPREVVHRLTAVQAQEFGPALWSIAQRMDDADESTLLSAVDDGEVLRTHVLRPTWHLVTPQDIRWLQAATGPRVRARNAARYRQLGLEDRTLGRSKELIVELLSEGEHLTRREIGARLVEAGIDVDGQRLAHIVMDAELEALICSGSRKGGKQTYALVDERAPDARRLDPDDAVVELVRRYLAAHGPATMKDLRNWSSLRLNDLRPAFDALQDELETEEHDGRTYWFVPPLPEPSTAPPAVLLVQGYDEYMLGYSDTRHVVDLAGRADSLHPDAVIPNHVVLVDGQLAGNWRARLERTRVTIEAYLYEPPDDRVEQGLVAAAEDHGRYLDVDAEVVVNDHLDAPIRFGTRRTG